jgi:hypothetical protein
MLGTGRFRRRSFASIATWAVTVVMPVAAAAISPAAALAQPSPASVSFTSGGGGEVTLSVTGGEASSDYADLDLTTSPHPNGYYAISNISGPVDPTTGRQQCQAVRSSLNCSTGVLVGPSFSATFTVSPQYPNDSVTVIVIGYPDDWSESITFCGPGTGNAVLERKLFDLSTLVSDQKTGASCPKIGVAGVRFAPRSQTQPSTSGLPVIWDRPGSVTTEHDQAGACPALASVSTRPSTTTSTAPPTPFRRASRC